MSAIRPNQLQALQAEQPQTILIDLRTPGEFEAGTIPGARNLPWSDGLAETIAARVPRSTPVVFVCAWGHRSVVASISLRRQGFTTVAYLEGGLESWGLSGMTVERGRPEHP